MLDILVVTAHPDDESRVTGIMLKAKKAGKTVGLVCHTRGEAGGFAAMQTRIDELKNYAEFMQLDYFKHLDYPDAGLEYNKPLVENLANIFRSVKPQIVLTPHWDDYHPDHVAICKTVDNAVFVGGLKREGDEGTWHPKQVLYFGLDDMTNARRPDIIYNISDVIEEKQIACNFHASQGIGSYVEPDGKRLGSMGGFKYGEALYIRQPLRLDDIESIFNNNKIGK